MLKKGDYYLHLADLPAYLDADQQLVNEYTDEKTWTRKAILNVTCSGKFSSDRTIGEYAEASGIQVPAEWIDLPLSIQTRKVPSGRSAAARIAACGGRTANLHVSRCRTSK